MSKRSCSVVLLAPLLLWGARVRAEPAPADVAAADAAFREGKELMRKGAYADACPRFEESQRLDPGVGTLLNLGDCYEKLGRTATAWRTFSQAVAAAQAEQQRDAVAEAQRRADALSGRVPTLLLTLAPGAGLAGLDVTVDGIAFDAADLGAPQLIDPGPHEVKAEAPGRLPFVGQVVAADGAQALLVIPALVSDGPPPPPPGPTASARRRSRHIIGLATAAAGVAALAVGSGFGLAASADWSDSHAHCGPDTVCDPTGVDLVRDAQSAATVSTVAFVVGGACLAAGAILYLTAPAAPAERAVGLRITPVLGDTLGLVVDGEF